MNWIEQELEKGNTVVCASCPKEIKKGDHYVIRGDYMYCDQECADADEEGG